MVDNHGELLPHSDKINIPIDELYVSFTWIPEEMERLQKVLESKIKRELDDWLTTRFKEEAPYLTFPFCWAPEEDGDGGPAVSDPTTIYIHLPALSEPNGVTYSVPLSEVIKDFLDSYRHDDGTIDPEQSSPCSALAKRLHELADDIESQLK
jgi:hypothetical protein